MVTAPAGGSPLVSRSRGQRLARAELSKPIYHHGESLLARISDEINRLLHKAGVSTPVGWWAVVALAAIAILIATLVVYRVGPASRSRRAPRTGPVLAGGELSAHEHREQAERLAAAGNFTDAIIESLRAIAVDLAERGVLPARTGQTASELAAEASQALPGHAGPLAAAARLFDDVRYGGRTGTAAGYQQVRDLGAAIRAARPSAAQPLPAADGAAL